MSIHELARAAMPSLTWYETDPNPLHESALLADGKGCSYGLARVQEGPNAGGFAVCVYHHKTAPSPKPRELTISNSVMRKLGAQHVSVSVMDSGVVFQRMYLDEDPSPKEIARFYKAISKIFNTTQKQYHGVLVGAENFR